MLLYWCLFNVKQSYTQSLEFKADGWNNYEYNTVLTKINMIMLLMLLQQIRSVSGKKKKEILCGYHTTSGTFLWYHYHWRYKIIRETEGCVTKKSVNPVFPAEKLILITVILFLPPCEFFMA